MRDVHSVVATRRGFAMKELTLASLFDGSGGFPLAGTMSGITPKWASEIEPFPIRVTTKRFPKMKHYGNVSEIKGDEVEPVDIITFGSPCQDLSTAGSHEGLSGSRSGLFFEAIRIIKEMREKTNGVYPRYVVWENVPGAFSSNKGEDFYRVLKEICAVKGCEINAPRPNKWWGGAGLIMGNNFSIGWRVLDAQYWGVAQRRRRIYLVADFNGQSAEEILFKSESLYWNTRKSEEERQNIARTIKDCVGDASHVVYEHHGQDYRIKELPKVCCTLNNNGDKPLVLMNNDVKVYENHGQGSRYKELSEVCTTVTATYGMDHHTVARKNIAHTLLAIDSSDGPCVSNGEYVRRITPKECCRLQGFPDGWCDDLGIENPTDEDIAFWDDVFETHRKIVTHGVKRKTENQIRRWLKDPHTDSAEYKMWGNGVALPNVHYLLNGIAHQLRKGDL